MNPPKGMVSPRGPVFSALIERVEAPDPDTVIVHGKGPSSLLLPIFANGWSVIIPKAYPRKGSGERSENHCGRHRTVQTQGTTHHHALEARAQSGLFSEGFAVPGRNRDPYHYGPPGPGGRVLSKRVFWTDSFAHPNLDRDLAQVYSTTESESYPHLGPEPDRLPFLHADGEAAL